MIKRNFISGGLGLLLTASILGSCQFSTEKSGSDVEEKQNVTTAVEEITFADPSEQKVYRAYIVLKNALVETNYETSKSAADSLSKTLAEGGMEAESKLAALIATDTSIEGQRKQFTDLNTSLITKFKAASLSTGKIFVQRCPMANNGDGGEWLASESNIRNPYYGDEMMECGSVIEEITVK